MGPIGSAVLTFIGYKQTDRPAKYIYNKIIVSRRTLANDERKKLNEMGHSQHVTSSTISLLLAREIDDIVNGVDDG